MGPCGRPGPALRSLPSGPGVLSDCGRQSPKWPEMVPVSHTWLWPFAVVGMSTLVATGNAPSCARDLQVLPNQDLKGPDFLARNNLHLFP